MKVSPSLTVVVGLFSLSLPACNTHTEQRPDVVVTNVVVRSPQAKNVTLTQQYVGQIRAHLLATVPPAGNLPGL